MPVDARHVCSLGKTGSEGLWVKTTRMTLSGSPGADRSAASKSRFQEANRGARITTCKHLSADARLRLLRGWHQRKIMGGFRDEIACLCNFICARAYPELRLRSTVTRPQVERRRAD